MNTLPLASFLDSLPIACAALRPYQRQGIAEIAQAVRDGERRILRQLPTGGGKTHEIAAITICAYGQQLRVLILATRTRLVRQIHERLEAFGVPHGIIAAELRGMFDDATTSGLSLAGDVVVLDLSAVYHSSALGALLTCAVGALEASWREGGGRPTVLVVDEAWAVLDDLAVARFLQSSWKLARAHGVANVAVVHRVSDLASAGSAGSVAAKVAEGLLSDSETLVCYGQAPAEAALAGEALGLTAREAALLTRLRRGVALWRVAGRSYLVEHRLAPGEEALVDTDDRLRV